MVEVGNRAGIEMECRQDKVDLKFQVVCKRGVLMRFNFEVVTSVQ